MISIQSPARPWQAWEKLCENPLVAAWSTAFVLTVVLSAVTIWRSVAVSFQPLSASGFLVVSLAAVSACLLLRITATRSINAVSGTGKLILAAVLSAAMFLLLLSISVSGTPVVALVAGWCLIVGAEASWWTLNLRPRPTLPLQSGNAESSLAGNRSAVAIESPIEPPSTEDEADETWPADMTQQLSRMRMDGGGESLFGGLRADFTPGERQRTVHLAFCPPLERKPEFVVEQSEGPAAQIEVTQLELFGVRMDVKLERAAKSNESVVLQFEATCRS